VFANHTVVIKPSDKILPSVEYQFFNAVTQERISSDVSMRYVDINETVRVARGKGSVFLGDLKEVPEGAVKMQPEVKGFTAAQSKILNYKLLKNPQEVIKVYLTPSLQEGKIRVVLKWPTLQPADLDLHCFTEHDHVYFSNKRSTDGSIELDTDCTSGNGCETITISPKRNVTYWFAVHHYAGEKTISESAAKVDVFIGNRDNFQRTFDAPTRYCQTRKKYWLVVALRNYQLYPKELITESDTPVDSARQLRWTLPS
jgi:hypothetical protein